ncbi:tetraacyldisaccharide 4'-kinase [Paucibacter oligotrophus]|uniref:Tetraacyldisaccharide 4'-kinase n=1 Tax=Roseateles oligotrophus TaxID=1769250 RepID=A0A840L6W0_9BURK|nr:tetraacyldisaccharide 4'-kinase [Roseateles oligotrophus]MBB4841899.1 tetraacyldisaccharide 4'-kinase [Roseateles oligotrophus]
MAQGFAARLQREWYAAPGTLRPWLSGLLRPLSLLYRGLSGLRALLYRCGLKKTATLPVPVIVVGNWIVGGAGKTPTTLALLKQLQALGLRAGVISRGYGRNNDELRLIQADSLACEVGDEPLLIHLRSGVPVAVGRDRVAVAQALLQAHPELQLLISDDGLQHLRLPRDLAVLVFDERGLGNGRLLPAGPLRQAPRSWLAPTELVLYNAARPSTDLPGHLAQRRLGGALRLQDWWQGQAASPQALQELRQRPAQDLLATAGMAHPQRFFQMLSEQGLRFQSLPLPDHYDFAELPWPASTPAVVLTEKDAIKLRPERCGQTEVWVVALDFQPDAAFQEALHERLQAWGLPVHEPQH